MAQRVIKRRTARSGLGRTGRKWAGREGFCWSLVVREGGRHGSGRSEARAWERRGGIMFCCARAFALFRHVLMLLQLLLVAADEEGFEGAPRPGAFHRLEDQHKSER
jgi:hypothetical protein